MDASSIELCEEARIRNRCREITGLLPHRLLPRRLGTFTHPECGLHTFLGGSKTAEIATTSTASILLQVPSDFEKSQNGLIIAVNKYSVGQGPDLTSIQTTDVLKKMVKDKDAPLFKLEVRAFDPISELGATYVTSESLLCLGRNAKKIGEWI